MGIIFKFALKCIKEKKFRTFLILFSIMMSSALFFASGAMSGSMEKMVVERIRKAVGSSEIMIYANSDSPSPYFSTKEAEQFSEKLEYAIGSISGSGIFEMSEKDIQRISLHGYKLEELQLLNPIRLVEGNLDLPFSGSRIIINSVFAKRHGYSYGDKIEIAINEHKHRFFVYGIAQPTGIFSDDGSNTNMLLPLGTLAEIYGVKGKVSTLYIRQLEGAHKQQLLTKLQNAYKRYTVTESIPAEDIKRGMESFTIPFTMMSVMVMIISVFIIYTSFRVITAEMLPVVGTFRSIGATRKMTDLVLLSQSLVYGILGGALGCAMGVGVLWLMSNMMLDSGLKEAGIKAQINFQPEHIVTAFLLAVGLSFVSSLIPIVRVSKIPVKDIVLNKLEAKNRKSIWKLIAGAALLAVVIIVPPFVPRELSMIVNSIIVALACISIVLLIPYLTKGFIIVFERVYVLIFGNEGVLAAKNLKDNKSMLNNISLLAMGISALLLINTISYSVFEELTNVYKNITYDVEVTGSGMDKSTLSSLRRIEGVEEVYGSYMAYGVETSDGKNRLMAVFGVDASKHGKYFDLGFTEDQSQLYERLKDSRSILLSTALKTKFKVEKGDTISLKTRSGDRRYTILGFFDSIIWNGQMGLISEKYFVMDMKQKTYSQLLLKTSGNPYDVAKLIKDRYRSTDMGIITIKEMEIRNRQQNAAVFNIFNIFSIMTMVIGVFGVLNNYAISFIERKRSLAMMRSMGMSRLQTVKMIFVESLSGGFVGGCIGVIMGVLMIMTIPYVLRAMDMPINMHYSIPLLLKSIAGGALVAVVASISPAFKSSRFNIIEAVKYE
ncbi:MAG: FtsX-like permease family protein [Bacillota bacterium]